MRLISICPSNTELCEYLGLSSSLVAVDDYSDWPQSILALPRVGGDLSIDMNKVQALKPDLVLASLSVPGMERNIEELKARNIPHIILNPNSLNEIANDLVILGNETNKSKEAKVLVEKFNKFIQLYKDTAAQINDKPRIYWEWWPKPVFSPGGLNWLTEISALAGATNIFADKPIANVQSDWQEVQSKDPEHICMVWVGVKENKMKKQHVIQRDGWSTISAVKANNVHILEEDLFCRPSPRILLGLQKLAYLLHPDNYPEFDDKDPLLDDN